MKKNRTSGCAAHARRDAWTIFELVAAIVILATPLISFQIAAPRWGTIIGIAVAVGASIVSIASVVAFYTWASFYHQRKAKELLCRYPCVYRIVAEPDDENCILVAEGARVAVGDYGWDAEPVHDDGLTYLHGLADNWDVVWYAGFRAEQIESVGLKPCLQYYLPYDMPASGCPFPVQVASGNTLGEPSQMIDRWVQGHYVPRRTS